MGTAATMEIQENLAIAARRGQHRTLKWGISSKEKRDFKEMLSIVQLLKNYNCTYRLKASECDYMVTKQFLNEDGTERFCTKASSVK